LRVKPPNRAPTGWKSAHGCGNGAVRLRACRDMMSWERPGCDVCFRSNLARRGRAAPSRRPALRL
jgi:hypothetical protein